MPFCRIAFYSLVIFWGILPIACNKPDRIESYDIPKIAPPPKEITDSIVEYRLWGVIVPAGDTNSWFFKIHTKAKTLEANEALLKKFVESISFPNGLKEKPVWVLPEGWKESRDNSMRIATLTFSSQDKTGETAELSVMSAQGSVIDNVNRWRNQAGSKPITEDKIDKLKVAGFDAYIVDVKGRNEPVSPAKMGMPRNK
jgi:hypothetical protein